MNREKKQSESVAHRDEELRSHVGLDRVAEVDAELEPGAGVGEPGADLSAPARAAEEPHAVPVSSAPLGKSTRVLATSLHAASARPPRRRRS